MRTALREQRCDEGVHATIRAVASVRLARNHGVELGRDAAGARELLGGGLLWQLLESERSWARLRVGGDELTQIVEELERL